MRTIEDIIRTTRAKKDDPDGYSLDRIIEFKTGFPKSKNKQPSEEFKRRQKNMKENTIVIVVPDFSEREEDIGETVERIWESFDLEEKLYVLEKVGYPLI